jgi:hypothetical protein
LGKNTTLNATTNATNTWAQLGDYTSFFNVPSSSLYPVLGCTLLKAGCDPTKPYTGTNIVMGTTSPFSITALNDGIVNYNDNVCVSCWNKYVNMTYDNFGVGTIDCSASLFISDEADSKSIKSDYERGKNENLEAVDFFHNDRPSDCPIKTCSLLEKGCRKTLDNENVAIVNGN